VSRRGDPNARWLLAGLGAGPEVDGPADLVPEVVDAGFDATGSVGAGLPEGTLDWAASVAAALAALGGWLAEAPLAASALGVAVALRLPEVMAAAYRAPAPPPARPPERVGSGWVHADLGAPGDESLWAACRSTLPPGVSAGSAAAEAQAWRLPVCDYRPWVPGPTAHPLAAGGRAGGGDRGFVVIDLTAMWAGPLATWLLARLGAKVVKVEPAARPDGFRALDGRGIHPEGRSLRPGRDSALFHALNHGKATARWDLRRPADRRRFEARAAEADLVVDAFSARVMGNLGWADPPAGATRVALCAFPPGPEREWVAYGSGVHAVSGLGDTGSGRFAPPPVSYPDPLGGLVLALGGAAAMVGRRRGVGPVRVETSLLWALGPLRPAPEPPGSPDLVLGERLLQEAVAAGLMERRPVGGRRLWHPRTIFRASENLF
jgi:hypothetical protein